MNQRYEILYKNNEFLQEFIGQELWMEQKKNGEQKISGNALNHNKTYVSVMQRILREHWKHCDVPVSPHKILIWSTDKNCKITSLSASHMIYDRKKKETFSDLITSLFGVAIGKSFFSGQNATSYGATTDTGLAKTLITRSGGLGALSMFSTGASGMQWQVGLGQRAGNLRNVVQLQTPCISAPENGQILSTGDGAFNTINGLLSNGSSYSSGGNENLTEVATMTAIADNAQVLSRYLIAYDLINFPTSIAQVVNIASSIQL